MKDNSQDVAPKVRENGKRNFLVLNGFLDVVTDFDRQASEGYRRMLEERYQTDNYENLNPDEINKEIERLIKSDLRFSIDSNNEIARSTVDLINLTRERGVETLVFLDKSARPLGWLFLRTWQEAYPDEVPPVIKFINIGSESSDWQEAEKQKAIYERYHLAMDGKTVCVIDEFKETGVAMMRAKKMLEKTFPEAKSLIFKYSLHEQQSWSSRDAKVALGVKDAKEEKIENAFGFISESIKFKKVEPSFWEEEELKMFENLRHRMSSLAIEIARLVRKTEDAPVVENDVPSLNERKVKERLPFMKIPDLDALRGV